MTCPMWPSLAFVAIAPLLLDCSGAHAVAARDDQKSKGPAAPSSSAQQNPTPPRPSAQRSSATARQSSIPPEPPLANASDTFLCKVNDLAECAHQCSSGHAGSCSYLGLIYYSSPEFRDRPRAAELFRKGCAGNDGFGCLQLADLYRTGDAGLAVDQTRANDLFQAAIRVLGPQCEAKDGRSCRLLAEIYGNGGYGLSPDERHAGELEEQACTWGDALGCYSAGVSRSFGRGVPKSEQKAIPFFRRGCDAGVLVACRVLGEDHIEGKGVPRDRQAGTEILQKACSGGDKISCELLEAHSSKE